MVKIINKLNQRIMINLPGGRILNLLAGGSLLIPDAELVSPHLQALLDKKYLAAVPVAQVDTDRVLSRPQPPAAISDPKPPVHSAAAKQTKGTSKGKGSKK
jgi:hypothetical protein